MRFHPVCRLSASRTGREDSTIPRKMAIMKRAIEIMLCGTILLVHRSVALDSNYLTNLMEPYTAVIFTTADLRNQTVFIRNFVNSNPAFVVKMDKNFSKSLKSSILHNSRRESIYVIIPSSVLEVAGILLDIAKMAPKESRPKTLLLLLEDYNHDEFEEIKTTARSFRFLDFSIVRVDGKKVSLKYESIERN